MLYKLPLKWNSISIGPAAYFALSVVYACVAKKSGRSPCGVNNLSEPHEEPLISDELTKFLRNAGASRLKMSNAPWLPCQERTSAKLLQGKLCFVPGAISCVYSACTAVESCSLLSFPRLCQAKGLIKMRYRAAALRIMEWACAGPQKAKDLLWNGFKIMSPLGAVLS